MAAKQGIERLSARAVQTAAADLNDGGGLMLRMPRTSGGAPVWVFRFTAPDGRRRELGLGIVAQASIGAAGQSLREAREAAAKARALLRDGIDPIEHRQRQREQAKAAVEAAKRAEAKERTTLARVARQYHEQHVEPLRNRKHAANWIASLETHVPAAIWHAPIDSIAPAALFDFFASIRRVKPELGKRVAQRLRRVFAFAEFRGLLKGNPAAAAMEQLRGIDFGHRSQSFAALPFAEVPAFVAELRQRPAIAAKALLFGIYTWARTNEIVGATWDEIHGLDSEDPRWVVPAARMKAKREHVVPLSPPAVAILREQRALGSPRYTFPSPESVGSDDPRPLSNMAMLTLLRRMDADGRTTVHGLCRQSSSTWANELGVARPDVIEAALAHGETNQVRKAYNKAQYLAERRALLRAWADYVDGREPQSNVVPLARVA